MQKECRICCWKYSCGYSSLLAGKQTGTCCEPHGFRKVKKNYWSYHNQRFETAQEIEKEEFGD
jgi:hypothetical protein